MLRNIGSNWFLMVVTGLATFTLLPYNLGHLGADQYGLWLVIAALTAYLYMLHLGVPMASVRQMTQAIAANDYLSLNRVVASCAGLYVGFGLLVCLLGVPLLMFFEQHYVIPQPLRETAHWAFMLAVLQTGLAFITNLPYAVLSAYQAFVAKNALQTVAMVVRIVLNLVLIAWYPNLLMLAVVNLAVTASEFVLCWGYVLYSYPNIRPRMSHVQTTTIRSIFGFSGFVLLMALGSQLPFHAAAPIIGHVLTTADIVTFQVPNSLMLILLQLVGGISSVIIPLSTNLQTRGDHEALRTLLFKWTKLALALTWIACLYLLIFGPSFLAYWIKSSHTPEAGHILRILTVSYLVALPVHAVAVPILMGLGNVKWPTLTVLCAGVLNLFLSVLWIGPYGLAGVAWGTCVPNLLLSAVMTYLVCRELKVSIRDYLAATVPLAAVGGFAGLAVLGWWHEIVHPAGLFGLVVAGLLTVAVGAAIWIGLVLRNDRHVALPPLSDFLRGRVVL